MSSQKLWGQFYVCKRQVRVKLCGVYIGSTPVLQYFPVFSRKKSIYDGSDFFPSQNN